MSTNQCLTGANWRKSTYSSDTGGECVECAPLGNATWQKSTHSGDTGGQCIEVAAQACQVAVRDSKNLTLGTFTVSPAAFAAFVRSL
ncbi:DUF397 domain-containing protein [Streptomyces sp. NPDC089919]|uniref:DUF397 domain-containing protein n=1 Tax=Streptomyces sp. NPDC089919 TaxID=3155188 RepID=UPI0034226236